MGKLKKRIEIQADLAAELAYGENPQQGNAALYRVESDDPLAIANFDQLLGAPPSYNNYTDIDRLLQTVTHIAAVFDRNRGQVPYIAAAAKHGNVCGVAVGDSEHSAIKAMVDGDPRAIFGGSIMANFALEDLVAKHLTEYKMDQGKRLLDVIVALGFSQGALKVVGRKNGKLRALANPALAGLSESSLDSQARFRPVRGGFLAQDNYDFVLDLNADYLDKHGQEASNHQEEEDMLLGWAIGSTSTSNTISLIDHGRLIGNGVGQQDRVSAAELAIKKAKDAGHSLEGAVAYSDSFFPFPDGPQRLIDEGVSAFLTSSGSVQDEKVLDTIISAGAKLYTLPDAVGRGFYGH